MMTVHEKSLEELDWESSAGVKAFMNLVGAMQRCIDARALPEGSDAHRTALGLWAMMHGITSLLISFPNFEWSAIMTTRRAEAIMARLMATSAR